MVTVKYKTCLYQRHIRIIEYPGGLVIKSCHNILIDSIALMACLLHSYLDNCYVTRQPV